MTAVRKHVTAARRLSISEIARNMLTEANGDMAKATEKLANYASNIAGYRDELLRIGARKLLNEVPQTQRAAILREDASFLRAPHRMSEGAKQAQARMRMAGRNMKSVLLDLPYTIGGISKPLRDWTGAEIVPHAEIEMAKGASAVRNARFLLAVGKAAGDAKVGAVPGAEIERLHAEAMASDV